MLGIPWAYQEPLEILRNLIWQKQFSYVGPSADLASVSLDPLQCIAIPWISLESIVIPSNPVCSHIPQEVSLAMPRNSL